MNNHVIEDEQGRLSSSMEKFFFSKSVQNFRPPSPLKSWTSFMNGPKRIFQDFSELATESDF